MISRAVLLGFLLVACGGAPARTDTPYHDTDEGEGQCPARGLLASAADALGDCRAHHASDPGWPARGAYDTLLPRLASHLASLDPPRAVTPDEVQPLAEGIWELLDQVEFPAGSETARQRAEDATERLLRDRSVAAAPGAAIEALDAVTQIATVADPMGGADPCAGEALHVAEARAAESECTAAPSAD
jgi:hypothetical protein